MAKVVVGKCKVCGRELRAEEKIVRPKLSHIGYKSHPLIGSGVIESPAYDIKFPRKIHLTCKCGSVSEIALQHDETQVVLDRIEDLLHEAGQLDGQDWIGTKVDDLALNLAILKKFGNYVVHKLRDVTFGEPKEAGQVVAARPFDIVVQVVATKALGIVGDYEFLAEILARHHLPSVRSEAAKGLGYSGSSNAAEALSLALNDSAPEVRRDAAISLERIGSAATQFIPRLKVASQAEQVEGVKHWMIEALKALEKLKPDREL